MSTLDPEQVPFFGDEVFRWIMWDEPSSGPASQKGWSRKIGYTPKEYRRFVELVNGFRQRLGVPASEVEMVGYVLGRTKADLDAKPDESETNEMTEVDAGIRDGKEKSKNGKKKADVEVVDEDEKPQSKRKADVLDEIPVTAVSSKKKEQIKIKPKVAVEASRNTRSTRSASQRKRMRTSI